MPFRTAPISAETVSFVLANSQQMRILVISTQFPVPARDGASLRVLNLVRQLARHHQVTLLSLTDVDPLPEHLAVLEPLCRVYTVRHKRSRARRAWDLLASFFWREPYLVRIYRNAKVAAIVKALAAESDIVQGEFPYGGQYLRGLQQPTILDQHNVESDIIIANADYETSVHRRFFFRTQAKKMACYERRLCGEVNLVLATSEQDRAALAPFSRSTAVIPNGVNLRQRGAAKTGTVTFTGLMSYVANIDAMRYFCREIWPFVSGPDRHLWIVGKGVGPETEALKNEHVTVTGEVPDVTPYLHATSVFVAPLRIGSGTRIKILDAMAHGLPVVATSVGCAGLQVKHGENILIADNPKEFADALSFLLSSPAERQRLGAAGFQLVKQTYTWDAIGSQLESVYSPWQSVLSVQ